MDYSLYISALVLGFAGSLHCVGMCGPIALSMPVYRLNGASFGWGILVYFLGKTFSYMTLGAMFGLLGRQLALAGYQQALSMVLGLGMLIFSLVTMLKPAIFHSNRITVLLGNLLAPLMGKWMSRKGILSGWMVGLLNGLLPCGLVYVALSAATATGSLTAAITFMGLFGLATLPLLLFFLLFASSVSMSIRNHLRRWLPVFTALVAVLLLLRGLGWGIPFLSPELSGLPQNVRSAEAVSCH